MTAWLMRKSNLLSHEKIKLKFRSIIFIISGFLFSNCDISQDRKCEYIQFPTGTFKCVTVPEGQDKKAFQKAKTKCASLGMRLPTREEVKEAYIKKVIEHGEKQGALYWDSKEVADAFLRDFPLRCIR